MFEAGGTFSSKRIATSLNNERSCSVVVSVQSTVGTQP